METLTRNLAIVVMNDWIRPLTKSINSHLEMTLTEEDILKFMQSPDSKHQTKTKRSASTSTSTLYKLRDFPDAIEVIKIENHSRLFLVDKTLVVYVAARVDEEDEEIDEEYCDPGDLKCKPGVLSKVGEDEGNIGTSHDPVNYAKSGIPNPEVELGYAFRGKLFAVGSLIRGDIKYLSDEDRQLCSSIGVRTYMADKIKRVMMRKQSVYQTVPGSADRAEQEMSLQASSSIGTKRKQEADAISDRKRKCVEQ